MTREEKIAVLQSMSDQGIVSLTHAEVKWLLTELRTSDEELKKLRTATGVDMVHEQLAIANRQLTEMTARHDAAVEKLRVAHGIVAFVRRMGFDEKSKTELGQLVNGFMELEG
jgi:hypothetical protein